MTELVRLCRVDDLREGGMLKVEVLGCDYLVVKLGEEIFVLDASCTHEWGDLSDGQLEGDIVTCPVHEGRFNARTGEVVEEPPTYPLQTYHVKVENGEVLADVTGY